MPFDAMRRLSRRLKPNASFDLLRWFAAISLVCVIASGVGTASLLGHVLTTNMLERDATVSADFLQSIVQAEQTWSYFANPTSAAAREPLESLFNHVARMPGVVRANVFARDETVLWSSDQALIGRRFADNDELRSALRGRIVVEAGRVGDHKEEHVPLDHGVAGSRFMEAYLPIWDQDHRAVLGVVEIYRLPETLFQAIDRDVRIIYAFVALSAALLYAALFGVVAWARGVMRQQQKRLLEAESLAAIGAVATAVAHGIRNPLASIRSSAELAMGEDDAARTECLQDIQRETDRLEGWVRELLLQARGESTAPSAIDVNQVLQDSVNSHAAKAERQGIRTTVHAGAIPAMTGSAEALAQAIENLVSNAIEAMPAGGDMILRTSRLGSDRIAIAVSDTGTGLPPQLRSGDLTPYFSTKAHGTGLGLVLTRRIVQSFGGTLKLSSAGGVGTTAIIELPTVP